MRQLWWKILATLLLLFTVIVGLRTPLAPALVHNAPDRIAPGSATVSIQGYNTHFDAPDTRVWLDNDGVVICASSVQATSDHTLEAVFDVPAGLKKNLSDLVVSNSVDGEVKRYGAFFTEGVGSGAVARPCPAPTVPAAETEFRFPDRDILNESIRNLFFHVPMWFSMVVLMSIGVWKSIRVLRTNDLAQDRDALAAVQVGLLFGVLGLITGSLWARVTWETWWTTDPKLNGAAAGVLIYLAYIVLRGSVSEPAKRARLAAIYSVFAFTFMLLFFFVLPRLNAVDSLHPGNGGNPAFNTYDLDNRLRMVFYPACAGWILLGVWMYELRSHFAHLQHRIADANDR